MIKTLLKKEFSGFAYSMYSSGKKDTNRKSSTGVKVAAALGVVILVAMIVGVMAFMADRFCTAFCDLGLSWLYFGFMALMATIFGLITGTMTTYSSLYLSRDNEMLLSMPIKPSSILFSRLLMSYLVSFVFTLLVMLPTYVVYEINYSGHSFVWYPIWLVLLLVLPFVELALSLVLSGLIALITTKLAPEKKGIVTAIFGVAFMVVYFVGYRSIIEFMLELVDKGEEVSAFMRTWAMPFVWFGEASTGDFLSLILFALPVLAVFVIIYAILAKSFIKVVTTNKGKKRKAYKEIVLVSESLEKALYKRETKHYKMSPTYLLNTILGIVIMYLMAGLMLIIRDEFREAFLGFDLNMNALYIMGCLGLGMFAAMTPITAPSISIEAKTFWILQSMPIDMRDVIKAKLKLHLKLLMPAIILANASFIYLFMPSPIYAILGVLMDILYVVLFGVMGLKSNINRPALNWVNEAAAIKRSTSVMIVMFTGLGITLALLIAVGFLMSSTGPAVILTTIVGVAVFAIWTVADWKWLMQTGAKKLEHL